MQIDWHMQRINRVLEDAGIDAEHLRIDFVGPRRVSNETLRTYVKSKGLVPTDMSHVGVGDHCDVFLKDGLAIFIPKEEERPEWAGNPEHTIIRYLGGEDAATRLRVFLEIEETEQELLKGA